MITSILSTIPFSSIAIRRCTMPNLGFYKARINGKKNEYECLKHGFKTYRYTSFYSLHMQMVFIAYVSM